MNKQKEEIDLEIQKILYCQKGSGGGRWTKWVKRNGRFRTPVIVSHKDTSSA